MKWNGTYFLRKPLSFLNACCAFQKMYNSPQRFFLEITENKTSCSEIFEQKWMTQEALYGYSSAVIRATQQFWTTRLVLYQLQF